MARITGITCNHVKGINHLDVPCDFYPNKPNFLVAPNGSGKSSLATAFASLNTRRLKLADADRYNGEDWDDTSLSVTFDDDVTLSANADSNEIASRVDVQVVRSGLYANMTNRRVGRPSLLYDTVLSVRIAAILPLLSACEHRCLYKEWTASNNAAPMRSGSRWSSSFTRI